MRRAVFTQTDRIVREDENGAQLHEGCHPEGISRVVRERQEPGAERNEAAVKRNAVLNGAHTEFAHAEADVAPQEVVVRQAFHPRPIREVGARQVRRPTEEFGKRRCEGIQGLLTRLTGRHGFRGRLCAAERFKDDVVKIRGEFARQTAL